MYTPVIDKGIFLYTSSGVPDEEWCWWLRGYYLGGVVENPSGFVFFQFEMLTGAQGLNIPAKFKSHKILWDDNLSSWTLNALVANNLEGCISNLNKKTMFRTLSKNGVYIYKGN